jgi:sugar phosphate isomerase/epimerase
LFGLNKHPERGLLSVDLKLSMPHPQGMNANLSRREFIARSAAASSAMALSGSLAVSTLAAPTSIPPIVVFSKVFQSLKLSFADAAEVTAEAGLDGIDCPVRPGGEVLPERATDDLPRYFNALHERNLQLPLLTTAITGVSSPHTEEILRAAKKLGVQFYRLGFVERESDAARQIRELKAQLKDLAALNKQIGIGGLLQNHSPAGRTFLGGNLAELRELAAGFDPAQIGIAFDIGHALIVHGDDWKSHFEKIKSHLKVAYVKDATRVGRWVPFGQGEVGQSGYFKILKQLGYHAPISLHIEFDWSEKGKSKTPPALVKTLKESSRVLRQWLAEA